MMHEGLRRAFAGLIICLSGCCAGTRAWSASAPASPPAPTDELSYRARPGDNLITLGARLLRDRNQWRELQVRNHIANPLRIQLGEEIHIPYAWLRTSPDSASIVAVTGTVTRDGAPAAAGDKLVGGAVLVTGADGVATLRFADGSLVILQRASTLQLDRMDGIVGLAGHDIQLKLQGGRAESKVQPHRDVGRFEIRTPVAISAVRGTEFRTSFLADDTQAATETLDGTVGVAGAGGAVSVPAKFGTRVDRSGPPLPPVPLLPAPDLSGLPTHNAHAALSLEFVPVAGAARYRVQLASDAAFQLLQAEAVTATPTVRFATLADGHYWLRARAIDPLGLEGLDAVHELEQRALPDAPNALATQSGSRVYGTEVTLQWTAAGQAAGYRLQLARDAGFHELVTDRKDLETPVAMLKDMTAGKYFWRVAALGSGGENGEWSDTAAFTQRPMAPQPDEPQVSHDAVSFSWSAPPQEHYRVQVARDPAFLRLVFDRQCEGSAISMPRDWPGQYFVRVQALDPDGTADPFGPARSFWIPLRPW